MLKKTLIIVISLILIISIFSVCMADNFDIDTFDTVEEGVVPEEVTNLTTNALGTAISIVRIVASGGLIIIITLISIKYMTSSAGDRADIKKHAIAFVVAAIIIFGSTYIIEFLIKLSSEIKPAEGGETPPI